MRATVRRWYSEPALVEAMFALRPVGADAAAPDLDSDGIDAMRQRLRGFRTAPQQLAANAPVSRYEALGDDAGDGPTRLCLWNDERNRAVQFGPGVCAFNVLAPYGHYEDHLPSLQRLTQTYLEVANLPDGLDCSQRYLNVFDLLLAEHADELFSFYPPLPAPLIAKHIHVAVHVEAVEFENGDCTVHLWRGTAGATHVDYRLEVVSRSRHPVAADTEALLQWQQRAHQAVNRAFEMSITPACRKRLREL